MFIRLKQKKCNIPKCSHFNELAFYLSHKHYDSFLSSKRSSLFESNMYGLNKQAVVPCMCSHVGSNKGRTEVSTSEFYPEWYSHYRLS